MPYGRLADALVTSMLCATTRSLSMRACSVFTKWYEATGSPNLKIVFQTSLDSEILTCLPKVHDECSSFYAVVSLEVN